MHERCRILREFVGPCSTLTVIHPKYQTPYNYGRALTWTAVMTALSHLDTDFGSVVAIEAVNEPIMDAASTPGYGSC